MGSSGAWEWDACSWDSWQQVLAPGHPQWDKWERKEAHSLKPRVRSSRSPRQIQTQRHKTGAQVSTGVYSRAWLEDCSRKNVPRVAVHQWGAARSRRGRSRPFCIQGEMDRQAAGLSRRKLGESRAGPGQAGILRGRGTGPWMLSLLGMKRKRGSLRTRVQGKGGHSGVCARGVPRREPMRPATGSRPERSDGHVSGQHWVRLHGNAPESALKTLALLSSHQNSLKSQI